jgi:hypothetical protein
MSGAFPMALSKAGPERDSAQGRAGAGTMAWMKMQGQSWLTSAASFMEVQFASPDATKSCTRARGAALHTRPWLKGGSPQGDESSWSRAAAGASPPPVSLLP